MKTKVDYSDTNNWLALPAAREKSADVFYLYPTAWQKTRQDEDYICEIDDPMMRAGAKTAFDRQATAFETVGNIYAPYYRQADAAYCLSLPLEEQEALEEGIPKSDVMAAFDYFIRNYNDGRPYILAGHSQGANVLFDILEDYMRKNPEVYSRMIAAYVIGYSVTEGYLVRNPHLKFAEGPEDTGVIISYNTEAPEVFGPNPVWVPDAVAINPISWTRDETRASAGESLGSVVLDEEKRLVPVFGYADARVDKKRGVVICSTVDAEEMHKLNPGFSKGVFHSYDYTFYYFNLRENAERRAGNFFKKHREYMRKA